MKILIWQWGRRGGGPRFAIDLARGLETVPGHDIMMSLSRQSEIYRNDAVPCALPVSTYSSLSGYLWRVATAPWLWASLRQSLRRLRPDVAICAMPGPLDLVMLAALRSAGVPSLVFVHDVHAHPGDGYPGQIFLQKCLIRYADMLGVLSVHVAQQLAAMKTVRDDAFFQAVLPPTIYDHEFPRRLAHGGPIRFLFFGRLLHYKGLDMLADAVGLLPATQKFEMRVVGNGPESETLEQLRRDPRVRVENRWVPEGAIPELIAWADVVVLPYRESSQSGVAGAAVIAKRWAIATRVGGLVEQLQDCRDAVLCAPSAEGIAAAMARINQHSFDTESAYDAMDDWHSLAVRLIRYLDEKGR